MIPRNAAAVNAPTIVGIELENDVVLSCIRLHVAHHRIGGKAFGKLIVVRGALFVCIILRIRRLSHAQPLNRPAQIEGQFFAELFAVLCRVAVILIKGDFDRVNAGDDAAFADRRHNGVAKRKFVARKGHGRSEVVCYRNGIRCRRVVNGYTAVGERRLCNHLAGDLPAERNCRNVIVGGVRIGRTRAPLVVRAEGQRYLVVARIRTLFTRKGVARFIFFIVRNLNRNVLLFFVVFERTAFQLIRVRLFDEHAVHGEIVRIAFERRKVAVFARIRAISDPDLIIACIPRPFAAVHFVGDVSVTAVVPTLIGIVVGGLFAAVFEMYCKYGRLILFARFVIYPARHGRLGIEIVLRLRDAPGNGIILAVAADGAFPCAGGCPMVVIGARQLKLDIVFSLVRTAFVRNGINPVPWIDAVVDTRLDPFVRIREGIFDKRRQGDFCTLDLEVHPVIEAVAVVIVFQVGKDGANLVSARIGRHFVTEQNFTALDAVLPRHRDGAVLARRFKVNRF